MAYWVVLLMLHIQPIHAQRINHNFRNTSMSEALTTLAKAQVIIVSTSCIMSWKTSR